MQKLVATPAPGAFFFLGPVPSNHKYEVILVSVGNTGAYATLWLFGWIDAVPTLHFFDDVKTVVGQYGRVLNYEGLPLVAGEYFYGYCTTNVLDQCAVTLTYIDVDMS